MRPGSLAWASAVGNRAVQSLARQSLETDELAAEEGDAAGAAAPEPETAEAPPAEVGALEGAGIGHEHLAGLATVDELAEDALPD